MAKKTAKKAAAPKTKKERTLPALSTEGAKQIAEVDKAGHQFVAAIEAATAVPSSHLWKLRTAVNEKIRSSDSRRSKPSSRNLKRQLETTPVTPNGNLEGRFPVWGVAPQLFLTEAN